jgi:hypothetical protein
MGALLVTAASPVSLDKYSRKLAGDLGHALSQAVYTLACIGQMKASDRIIHDILPEKVRARLIPSCQPPTLVQGPVLLALLCADYLCMAQCTTSHHIA